MISIISNIDAIIKAHAPPQTTENSFGRKHFLVTESKKWFSTVWFIVLVFWCYDLIYSRCVWVVKAHKAFFHCFLWYPTNAASNKNIHRISPEDIISMWMECETIIVGNISILCTTGICAFLIKLFSTHTSSNATLCAAINAAKNFRERKMLS